MLRWNNLVFVQNFEFIRVGGHSLHRVVNIAKVIFYDCNLWMFSSRLSVINSTGKSLKDGHAPNSIHKTQLGYWRLELNFLWLFSNFVSNASPSLFNLLFFVKFDYFWRLYAFRLYISYFNLSAILNDLFYKHIRMIHKLTS